jgi:hypothetical protein
VIFLPGNGAVAGWNDNAAMETVYRNIRKPVFTCEETMMRVAVFGMTGVDREQGEWAAKTAIDILGGKSPGSIHVSVNRRVKGYINPLLAGAINFRPDPALLANLKSVRY